MARLAKPSQDDFSSDEDAKSTSSNPSDGYSPIIRPITYEDVASASEKIYYTGGITKTSLQVSIHMLKGLLSLLQDMCLRFMIALIFSAKIL